MTFTEVSITGDPQVIQEAKSDPQLRVARLYERYSPQISAYAARRAKHGDAADVVAETFLTAWRRHEDVPAEPETLPWLYGVARKVLANQRRSENRRKHLHDRLRSETPTSCSSTCRLESSEQFERMVIALDDLSEEDAELLRLTAWEGLTPSEIASIMGIEANAARQRLFRARGRLQNELDNGRASTAKIYAMRAAVVLIAACLTVAALIASGFGQSDIVETDFIDEPNDELDEPNDELDEPDVVDGDNGRTLVVVPDSDTLESGAPTRALLDPDPTEDAPVVAAESNSGIPTVRESAVDDEASETTVAPSVVPDAPTAPVVGREVEPVANDEPATDPATAPTGTPAEASSPAASSTTAAPSTTVAPATTAAAPMTVSSTTTASTVITETTTTEPDTSESATAALPTGGPFAGGTDLLTVHLDFANNDDAHAAVATAEVTKTMGVEALVVAATQAEESTNYVQPYDDVLQAAWGNDWIDAGGSRADAVNQAADEWLATIDNGGRVWVAEGGVSDFTAEVLREIVRRRPELEATLVDRVQIVHHNHRNMNETQADELSFVQSASSFEKIDDGNGENKSAKLTGATDGFETAADTGELSDAWSAAFATRPASELDFSDVVTVLHVLGVGLDEVATPSDFADSFMN